MCSAVLLILVGSLVTATWCTDRLVTEELPCCLRAHLCIQIQVSHTHTHRYMVHKLRNYCSHCSLDLEFLRVRCHLFYLPREFTSIVVVTMVPPQRDNKLVLKTLAAAINKQQEQHPDAAIIDAVDFIRINLKTVPRFISMCPAWWGEKINWTMFTQIFRKPTEHFHYHLPHRPHLSVHALYILTAPESTDTFDQRSVLIIETRIWLKLEQPQECT